MKIVTLEQYLSDLLHRPDMTCAVDWALNNNYLSIYLTSYMFTSLLINFAFLQMIRKILQLPTFKTKHSSQRSFSCQGPSLWNMLPHSQTGFHFNHFQISSENLSVQAIASLQCIFSYLHQIAVCVCAGGGGSSERGARGV